VNTMPTSLVHFQEELETAIRRVGERRRRRLVTRGVVAATAAAAVALGVLSALPGSEPSVVERAAAALRGSDGTILHTILVGTLMRPDGKATEVRIETWQASSAPHDQRQITVAGGRRLEAATANGIAQLYDPQTNTIYASPETKAGGPVGAPKPGETKPPAARSGKADASAASAGDSYRAKILGLLDAGRLRDAGWVSVAGERAIRLASDDGSVTLLVEPGTYQPIEWRVTENGTTAVARFPTYDRLPANDTSAALLSLRAQHPDATVDASPGAYEAARQRLAVEVR
jgi:hypothetical protein